MKTAVTAHEAPAAGLRIATNVLAPEDRRSASAMITAVEALRSTRMHVTDVGELRPADPHAPLAELARATRASGISCTLGALFISPTRPERNPVLAGLSDTGSWSHGLTRLVHQADGIGVSRLIALVGHLDDRLRGKCAWRQQTHEVICTLRGVLPALRDTGLTIALKTHPDLNTDEVLHIAEATDPDVVRVAFDPVNVVTRGEDPLEAARRLAGLVDVIAIDDMVVTRTADGIARIPVSLGSGDIPWPALLQVLPRDAERLLDLKRAATLLPLDDPAWRAAQGWKDPVLARDRISGWLCTERARVHADRAPVSREPLVYEEPWRRTGASLRALAAAPF
jgi:sugar phosphate isomerase/epimerase